MDAKRGYVPEDERNFCPEQVRRLRTASRHIRYLINEGYHMKQAVSFVGNHFLLSERQRLAIMRSLATDQQLSGRRDRQMAAASLAGGEVWIDGFNIIISLEVMLSDSLLFACMDGTVRDLAALRGTYRLIPQTKEAVQTMFQFLQKALIRQVHVLLDRPVSNSGRLKSLMADIGQDYSFDLDIEVIKDVDRSLYDRENVISSDSIILDHCRSWVSLTAECMEERKQKGIRVWGEEDYAYDNGIIDNLLI